MTTAKKNSDVEALTSETETEFVTLTNNQEVSINRLKTRETLKLLKILTRGVSGSIGSLLMATDDQEEFVGNLLGAVIIAFPEAEDETLDFIMSMVTPKGIIEDPRTKPEREANEEKWTRLSNLFEGNPELDDTVTVLEAVIRNEAPHIKALGNRLALLLKVQTSSATAKQSGSSRNASKN